MAVSGRWLRKWGLMTTLLVLIAIFAVMAVRSEPGRPASARATPELQAALEAEARQRARAAAVREQKPRPAVARHLMGVVVVPQDIAEETVRLAQEQADREEKTREWGAQGKTVEDLLNEFGRI